MHRTKHDPFGPYKVRCVPYGVLWIRKVLRIVPRPRTNKQRYIMVEYIPILAFLVVSSILSVLILSLSFIFGTVPKEDPEKLSAYECGFDPFDDARSRFDIRFYLVAILFIIFDLEVTYLFPWAVVLSKIGTFGFWTMIIFLAILTLGFVYEWKKGALEWE